MIYFVQAEKLGFIKIGHTQNWRHRRKDLMVACPDILNLLAFDDGGYEEEQELHKRFADDHHRGEWFFPSKALLDHIQSRRTVGGLARCEECGVQLMDIYREGHSQFCKECRVWDIEEECPEFI